MALNNPEYIENNFSVFFEQNITLWKKIELMERIFGDKYQSPQLTGIPDDIEPNFPRVVFTSKNTYSVISISQISLNLKIRYDENFSLEQKIKYLKERVEFITELLESTSEKKLKFIGLISTVVIPTSSNTESIDIINKKYLLPQDVSKDCLEDIGFKKSVVDSDRYSFNFNVDNFKKYKDEFNRLKNISRIASEDIEKSGIKISLDLNDRFLFNTEKEYYSSMQKANNIIDKNFELMKREIEYIKK